MSQQPTPRTKAAQAYCGAKITASKGEPYQAWYGYMSEHSAVLERELADAQAQMLALRDVCNVAYKTPRGEALSDHALVCLEQALSSPPPPVALKDWAQKQYDELLAKKLEWLAGCEQGDGKQFADRSNAELAGFLRELRLHIGSACHAILNASALRLESPVVSLEEHEKVKEDAERLATALNTYQRRNTCTHLASGNQADEALSAHEARKGAAV